MQASLCIRVYMHRYSSELQQQATLWCACQHPQLLGATAAAAAGTMYLPHALPPPILQLAIARPERDRELSRLSSCAKKLSYGQPIIQAKLHLCTACMHAWYIVLTSSYIVQGIQLYVQLQLAICCMQPAIQLQQENYPNYVQVQLQPHGKFLLQPQPAKLKTMQ